MFLGTGQNTLTNIGATFMFPLRTRDTVGWETLVNFAISVIVIISYTIEYVFSINKFTISYFIHGFNLLDAQKTMDILCILLMMDFVTKENF